MDFAQVLVLLSLFCIYDGTYSLSLVLSEIESLSLFWLQFLIATYTLEGVLCLEIMDELEDVSSSLLLPWSLVAELFGNSQYYQLYYHQIGSMLERAEIYGHNLILHSYHGYIYNYTYYICLGELI